MSRKRLSIKDLKLGDKVYVGYLDRGITMWSEIGVCTDDGKLIKTPTRYHSHDTPYVYYELLEGED